MLVGGVPSAVFADSLISQCSAGWHDPTCLSPAGHMEVWNRASDVRAGRVQEGHVPLWLMMKVSGSSPQVGLGLCGDTHSEHKGFLSEVLWHTDCQGWASGPPELSRNFQHHGSGEHDSVRKGRHMAFPRSHSSSQKGASYGVSSVGIGQSRTVNLSIS